MATVLHCALWRAPCGVPALRAFSTAAAARASAVEAGEAELQAFPEYGGALAAAGRGQLPEALSLMRRVLGVCGSVMPAGACVCVCWGG